MIEFPIDKFSVTSFTVSKNCEHSIITLFMLCVLNTRNVLLISERCLCVKQKHFSIPQGIVQSQLRLYEVNAVVHGCLER